MGRFMSSGRYWGKCLVEWTRVHSLGGDGRGHQNHMVFGGLAHRAAPHVVRKERQSFPSSPMASISRCYMPSACDC